MTKVDLDAHLDALNRGEVSAEVRSIIAALERRRASMDGDSWRSWVHAELREHALWEVLLEDPYMRRAYRRPRGYAGDGDLLDMIYFGLLDDYAHDPEVTPLGRAIFRETVGSRSGDAVRERRQRLAEAVDRVGEHFEAPRILAVAGGYLREASLSKHLQRGRIGRWDVLDPDAACARSLLADRSWAPAIRPIHTSLRRLFRAAAISRTPYHLVYSAGLLDYLEGRTARRLVTALFARLAAGGRLLVANFVDGAAERGYMEAVGDWWLNYRTSAEMEDLCGGLPAVEIASLDVHLDSAQRVLYLDVRRV